MKELNEKYLSLLKGGFLKVKKTDYMIGLLCLNLIFTAGLAFKSGPKTIEINASESSSKEAVSILSSQLTNIQKGLLTLKAEITKPKKEINLDAISSGVNQLSGSINQLAAKNEHQVRDIVTQSASEIHQQIGSLSKQVTDINNAQKGDVYLSSKALPFSVLSIDSVQEEGVVDVSYSYRTVALEAGDNLAGWFVKKVDFIQQKALFENDKHQFITIELKARGK